MTDADSQTMAQGKLRLRETRSEGSRLPADMQRSNALKEKLVSRITAYLGVELVVLGRFLTPEDVRSAVIAGVLAVVDEVFDELWGSNDQ